ncbi:MAG: ABC-F family ATP-binding cassette domain-containing protein [Cyanobacteriota bacterium]|nr:ABC-F family ATP-binding cassette domain-containing protein [Cyanobacteriota bacterium]
MSLISLTGAGRDTGIRTLFENLDLHVGEGDRLGLIGPNGAGKSTLLKVLAGEEPLGRGERWLRPRARVVLVSQEPELDPELTLLDQVFQGSGEKMMLLHRYAAVSAALAHAHAEGQDDSGLLTELGELNNRMDQSQAWGLEQQIRELLGRLGINDVGRRVGDLSGGYRKRLALAAALVADPDVLLLDEPTNHLDADCIQWLQGTLNRFSGALVLVTHDRYVLDQVTSRILEVDRGETSLHRGNYANYLARKAEQEAGAAAGEARFRGVLRRELEWLRRGPKARSTKQKARILRIEAMREAPKRQSRGDLKLSSGQRRLGKKTIEAEDLSVWASHEARAAGRDPLLRGFSYSFSAEDRVGIIGANGSGKSTLLNLIAGRGSHPWEGRLELGSTVKLAYFDQHSEELIAALDAAGRPRKVIDVVLEAASSVEVDGKLISASQLLERFLFPPAQQHQPVSRLSGGERRRLHLCRLLIEAPNLLLLDEPTNDLDVRTLTVLEDFLEDFRGCVVMVSHDRYFLDRTVDRLFAFEAGVLHRHEGNYSAYLEQRSTTAIEAERGRDSTPAAPRPAPAPSPSPMATLKPRRRSFRENRELSSLETDLARWEARRSELEQLLASDNPDYASLELYTSELATLIGKIEAGEDRWLELSELAD